MNAIAEIRETGGRQTPLLQQAEWLQVLGAFAGPASLVEKGIAQALALRERSVARYPRQAAVLGIDKLGLLAALLLRLRRIEVVAMDQVGEPLLTPRQVAGRPGWKHVGMSKELVNVELFKEIGVRYVSFGERTLQQTVVQTGPFDLVVAVSTDSCTRLEAPDGFAENGVMLDLRNGGCRVSIAPVCAAAELTPRHEIELDTSNSDGKPSLQALKDLARADVEYPGWLLNLLANSAESPASVERFASGELAVAKAGAPFLLVKSSTREVPDARNNTSRNP